ncbi:MAG: hypothetical protein ACLSCV_06175 [Acutalibacteraceae bacterium]
MRKHAELARSMGMNSENIFIGTIGDAVELNQNYMKQLPSVPAGRILVDGLGVGDVGSIVLMAALSEDGLIVVVYAISKDDSHVLQVDVVSGLYMCASRNVLCRIKRFGYTSIGRMC